MTARQIFPETPDHIDPDAPPLTAAQIDGTRPFTERFPDLAATIGRRGTQKAPVKVRTTIRLSPEVMEYFRAAGAGWQSRIDKALRDWIAERAA